MFFRNMQGEGGGLLEFATALPHHASLCPVSPEPARGPEPERVSVCGRSSGLQPTGEGGRAHRRLQGDDPGGTCRASLLSPRGSRASSSSWIVCLPTVYVIVMTPCPRCRLLAVQLSTKYGTTETPV